MSYRQILILRHAEKPNTGQGLSERGEQRAQLIADYIPNVFGEPDYIYAAGGTLKSMRPFLTIMPLWNRFKDVILDTTFEDRHVDNVATQISKITVNHHKNIVICWHHGQIPELLNWFCHFGKIDHDYNDPWPEEDYSSIYQILIDKHGKIELNKHSMDN